MMADKTFIPHAITIYCDEAENTTSKSHDPRALLMAPAQQEETIFVECTGVVPAKCPPKMKSELFSLLQSAREGKLCVHFFVMVLGFYNSRAGPFFLEVEVLSLQESLFGHILRDLFHIGVVLRFTQNVESKSSIYSFKRGYQEIPAWRRQHI